MADEQGGNLIHDTRVHDTRVHDIPVYDIPAAVKGQTAIDPETYQHMYERSVQDPEGFWAEQAEQHIDWFQKWDKVLQWDFDKADIQWFLNGKLNVSYNCLDRHVNAGAGDQTALIWQGNNEDESKKISYAEMLEQVCQFANALKALGVKKGDRVCLYLQMIPDLPVAMLACTLHSCPSLPTPNASATRLI